MSKTLTPAEAKRLYAEHGSQRKAAAAAGVSLGMMQRRLRAAAEQAAEARAPLSHVDRYGELLAGGVIYGGPPSKRQRSMFEILAGCIKAAASLSMRRPTQIGPGQRSVLALHRKTEANRIRNRLRGIAGRYNWN